MIDLDRSSKLFEFTWTEAVAPAFGWDARFPFELAKCTRVTIGWVLQQDRDYMAVATDHDPVNNLYLQVIAIPRACIVKIREVLEDD